MGRFPGRFLMLDQGNNVADEAIIGHMLGYPRKDFFLLRRTMCPKYDRLSHERVFQ